MTTTTQATYQREYARTHRDKKNAYLRAYRARHREEMRLRVYGMTPAQYQQRLDAQGGVCAICGRPERRQLGGHPAHLSVDHDHTTARVRGLLCHSCNVAIGHFGDDPMRLQRALEYLLLS